MPQQTNSVFYPAITMRGPSGYDPKFHGFGRLGMYTPVSGFGDYRAKTPAEAGIALVSSGTQGFRPGSPQDLVSGGINSGPLEVGSSFGSYLGQLIPGLPTIQLSTMAKYGIMGAIAFLMYRKTIPMYAGLAAEAAAFLMIEEVGTGPAPVSTTVPWHNIAGIPVDYGSQ